MSQAFFLSLLVAGASVVSAGHAHQRPNHKHDARQMDDGMMSILYTQAAPTPVIAPAPSSNDIGSVANELESCLIKIPQDITALMSAIDARLAEVQNQVSSLLSQGIPTGLVPIPTAAPALAVSSPAIVAPQLSQAVSSPAAPSVYIASLAAPPVSYPSVILAPSVVPSSAPMPVLPTTSVPAFSFPAQAFQMPTFQFVPPILNPSSSGLSVAAPGVPIPSQLSVPAVSSPTVSPPALGAPVTTAAGLAVSANTAPALSSVNVPSSVRLPITISTTVTNRVTLTSTGTQTVTTRLPLVNAVLPAVSSASPVATQIPSQFINTVPRSFTTVTDVAASKPSVSSPTVSSYVFNPDARDNLAVYYGNTPATDAGGLATLCSNPHVDMVVLSFVFDFFSQLGYPSIYFGTTSCAGQTAAQAARAPGLRDCSPLATQIVGCQAAGKKILVSMGGYIANSSFTSDLQAKQFAVTMWNLFGPVSSQDADLRPFGANVVVDGFDIDNEDGSTAYWDTFASTMRALFNNDSTKRYYLSAAPQCPQPDASIPISAMQHADFVWPQFYNNPSCNLDSAGFQSSFSSWSRNLTNSSLATNPRLYVGAPAFPDAGSGWVNSSSLSTRISLAKSLMRNNFGGIMLWDGSEALADTDKLGNSYIDYAKWSLQY